MRLLTVRLSEADDHLAKELRASGVRISDLVRNALRSEHQVGQERKPRTAKQVRELLARIDAKFPIPSRTPAHGIDIKDAKAVRAHIVSKLKRKKPR